MRDENASAKRVPASTPLVVLHTLVQSAGVALFHSYGIATAPLEPLRVELGDFRPHYPLAVIGLKAPGIDASLILSLPREVSSRMQLAPGKHDERALVRELVNQAMGRVKNRLTQYQVTLTSGLPACADRSADLERLAPQQGALTVYRLRTIHGFVLLATRGVIDTSRLNFAGVISLNSEGDIIVFDDP
jgi:hypothetical protein